MAGFKGDYLELSQVIVTHPCVYDERLEQLEQVYTLLNRLNSSDLVLEVSKELDKSVPDMMDSVCALIGTLREYRAVSAAHI